MNETDRLRSPLAANQLHSNLDTTMGKKSKRNRSKNDSSRPAPALRANTEAEAETTENLRFEDPYPEEYEEEADVWEDNEAAEGEDGGLEIVQAWNPLTGQVEPGQKLEMDPSAYKMYHALSAEWPSLSFDFVRDDLGESRTRFPHSLVAVTGSQAERPEDNQVTVIKLSDLSRIQHETEDDILGEEYDPDKEDDESESDSDEEVDLDPVLESYSIKHYGGVNRIRTMPQQSTIVAAWSDAGTVNLYDIEPMMQRFSVSEGRTTDQMPLPTRSFFTYSKHSTEGYAMDWSPVRKGALITGDCRGSIHLWSPLEKGGYNVVPSYSASPKRSVDISPSVEDLQWSPTEATVFASAECGGYVRIFDTRAPNKAMIEHQIHASAADVNVLSWNKLVGNLLATGSDDGVLSVWDLRHFQSSSVKPLARFTPHKTPITSVEWHSTDESMLAVSDDSGTYIYDLSVEEDDTAKGQQLEDVPPQLLFVHCGSEQFKEVHWHPQISSLLMTTALSGYSVFIPSNL